MALFLASLWCLFLIPSYGLCATLTVCSSGCDFTTISGAIQSAQPSDVISVFPTGDYTEASLVNITFALTITCVSSDSALCVVNATNGWLSIVSGGVLTLNGTFVVTSISTSQNAIQLSSNGTWNLNGTIMITTTTSVYAVSFYNGGTWNQYGTANISAIATASAYGAYGVYFYNGGTWNQYGTANISAIATSGGVDGVFFENGGTWNQYGTANISAIAIFPVAVIFYNGGTWNQYGTANISAIATSADNNAYGVYFYNGGTWNQNGTANISAIATAADGYGVYFGDTSSGNSTWNQYGGVLITASYFSVYFEGCGTWNEYGTTNIPNSAIHRTSSCDVVNIPPSASPTHLPIVSPIVENVVANFSSSIPAVNITSAHTGVGVKFNQASTSSGNIVFKSDYSVNSTGEAGTTIFTYRSALVNISSNATVGSLDQVFSFSQSQQASLSKNIVPPASVKWSLIINTSIPLPAISMTFSLADLSTSGKITNATLFRSTNSTSDDVTITTYYLPLVQGHAIALLKVLDSALVDGVFKAIAASVLPSGNTTQGGGPIYTLTLHFPAFTSAIEYDPSLSMSTLVGPLTGGSTDLGLILGTTVGISVGVILVLLIIVTGSIVGLILARRRKNQLRVRMKDLGLIG